MKSIVVPLYHGMIQVFQGGEPGCWASPFRLATKVVVELHANLEDVLGNIYPQKMTYRKCLVFPLDAKVRILAIFNTRIIITSL